MSYPVPGTWYFCVPIARLSAIYVVIAEVYLVVVIAEVHLVVWGHVFYALSVPGTRYLVLFCVLIFYSVPGMFCVLRSYGRRQVCQRGGGDGIVHDDTIIACENNNKRSY